jgi:excinuclease UvrABC nuclease subunit
VSPPALAFVPLAGDAAGALARVPSAAGVGQILGPEGRSLLVSVASNLRRWAGSHLGLGKPATPGRRPRTNLAGIATAIGWVEADGAFRQRLLYERLVAPLVPPSTRRDLKPPTFLHLDPSQRFPRVSVRGGEEGPLFGPFRDRRAAEKARDAVLRLFPLRPCDFTFEPDPALPLGLACLYAQVRSCAAPCLARVGEGEYRALAARAAAWLADPSARGEAPVAVPPLVSAVQELRAVVVDAGRREVSLFPVRRGRVVEEAAVTASPDELEEAVGRLAWPERSGPDDWPWLGAWLRGPRGRASWVAPVREDGASLAAAVRAALPPRFAGPARGGNVGPTRGEA